MAQQRWLKRDSASDYQRTPGGLIVSTKRSRNTERFMWMLWAPFEFAITIIIGVPLYFAWAVFVYLRGLRGLFARSATLLALRFRVGRVCDSLSARGEMVAASEVRRPQLTHAPRPLWLN